jgi:hypothetical protein
VLASAPEKAKLQVDIMGAMKSDIGEIMAGDEHPAICSRFYC